MPGASTDLRVQIEPSTAEIRPGGQAPVQVRVVNISGIVDTFEVTLVGSRHPGLTAEPQRAKLLKNQERVVPLLIKASLDHAPPAGRRTVGVRVVSVSDPSISWVEELDVSIPAVGAPVMVLEPTRVKGGSEATLHARVTNESNQPSNLGFAGSDTESTVEFAFTPRAVFLAPGEQADVLINVQAKPPFTGVDVHRMLSVVATSDTTSLTASATFLQSPRVSTGVLRVIGSLGALALLGGSILIAALIVGGDDDVAVATTTLAPDAPAVPTVAANQQVPVPAVQGLDVNSAGQALAAVGLTPNIQSQADPSAPAGTVVGSQPGAGTALQPGSTVTLLVSIGPEPVPSAAIPAVSGLSLAEANTALATACEATPCFVSDLSSAFSNDVDRDLVIGSAPAEGQALAAGSTVTLFVSLGPEAVDKPDTVVTPIVGNWVNTTPGIGEITRLVVSDASGEPLVQAFKRCGADECSIDQDVGAFNGSEGSVELADFSFIYDVAFASVGDTLEVESVKTFSGPIFTSFTIIPEIFLQPVFPFELAPVDLSPSPGTTLVQPPPPPPATVAIFRRS